MSHKINRNDLEAKQKSTNKISKALSLGLSALLLGSMLLGCEQIETDGYDEKDQPTASKVEQGIFNGNIANDTELMRRNRAIVTLDDLGSGILIGPRVVLTVAHNGVDFCGTDWANQDVEFGIHTTAADRLDIVSVEDTIDVPGEDFPAKCSRQGHKYDLGVWILEEPTNVALPWTRFVQAISNPGSSSEFSVGDETVLWGYGGGDSGHFNWLEYADCEISKAPYFNSGDKMSETKLDPWLVELDCPGNITGEGGDSGGPLFNGSGELFGLHRASPGTKNSEAVFLYEGYLNWIQERLEQFETEMHIGDFDGDGIGDLLYLSRHGESSWVDLSNGSTAGLDGIADDLNHMTCSAEGEALVGDFDGDGLDDLACHDVNGSVNVHFNKGGRFDSFPEFGIQTWCAKGDVTVGNFDGQKGDDLFCRLSNRAINPSKRMIALSKGTRTNPFHKAWYSTDNWCDDSREMHAGDFNNDGRDDLLCRTPGYSMSIRHSSMVRMWNGTYAFAGLKKHLYKKTAWCGPTSSFHVGDFDNRYGSDLLCQKDGWTWLNYSNGSTTSVPFTSSTNWSFKTHRWCEDADDEKIQFGVAKLTSDNLDEMYCYSKKTGQILINENEGPYNNFDSVSEISVPNVWDREAL